MLSVDCGEHNWPPCPLSFLQGRAAAGWWWSLSPSAICSNYLQHLVWLSAGFSVCSQDAAAPRPSLWWHYQNSARIKVISILKMSKLTSKLFINCLLITNQTGLKLLTLMVSSLWEIKLFSLSRSLSLSLSDNCSWCITLSFSSIAANFSSSACCECTEECQKSIIGGGLW